MTGNPRREYRRKQARDFLDGPAVASWFRAARLTAPVGKPLRSGNFDMPQSAGIADNAKI